MTHYLTREEREAVIAAVCETIVDDKCRVSPGERFLKSALAKLMDAAMGDHPPAAGSLAATARRPAA